MKSRKHKTHGDARQSSRAKAGAPVGVRIIGGRLRGRKLHYSGDLRTRPMKDRLRESVFNRVGPAVRGKHAVDLFAGTGALGLEALSRGASRATLIEQHVPTARDIQRSAVEFGIQDVTDVVTANTLLWFRRRPDLGPVPWLVFCSPPYDFYVERAGDMQELIRSLIEAAPPQSIFVVESDARFDFQQLPDPAEWDVRATPPAVVGIYEKVT
jgi:16S rRNA (guanine966-N2)-methyltransferase